MKKIIFCMCILATLSGCGKEIRMEDVVQSDVAQSVKNTVTEKAQESISNGTEISNDTCLSGCAVMTGEGLFSRETCEGSCWADEAKERKDVKICDEKIAKENSIPKMACYLNVAEATGDPAHCDKIADDKKDLMVASCYSSVADKYKNAELCDGIKDTLLYEPCIADANSAE